MNRAEFMRKVSEIADQFHGMTLDDARDVLASVVITVGQRTNRPDLLIDGVIDLLEDSDSAEKVPTKDITQ